MSDSGTQCSLSPHDEAPPLAWVTGSGSLAELNVRGKCRKGILHRASISSRRSRIPGPLDSPPLDAFNSMVSLGYSPKLYKNIIAIERHSLNAYNGFTRFTRARNVASDHGGGGADR